MSQGVTDSCPHVEVLEQWMKRAVIRRGNSEWDSPNRRPQEDEGTKEGCLAVMNRE
jgi:hypothetical protein